MSDIIDDQFNTVCRVPSDINEHLPIIAKYASECDTIVEMGVRFICSTWAFLKGNPKKLTSIDIVSPPENSLNLVRQACMLDNIDFSFIKSCTLDIEIDECDLLFIDTLHTYEHLVQELKLHGNKATKYLMFHDTEVCGEYSENNGKYWKPGLLAAIDEFIEENPHWIKKKFYTNNNGLGILERVK